MPRNLQVISTGGKWALRRSGSARATRLYSTKREAVAAGKRTAKRDGVTLYIHGRDGRVARRIGAPNQKSREIIKRGAKRYAKALKSLADK